MLFTVELECYIEGSFRLQKDGSWRECTSDKKLQESDFTCTAVSDVTKRSNNKGMLEINGIAYEIDPVQVDLFGGKVVEDGLQD